MLQPRLARFKQPKRILILQKLPGNAMGKVQKKGLRDLNAGLFSKS
jgi:malonyl-CoA/methylmalonyl-CoA synthetase